MSRLLQWSVLVGAIALVTWRAPRGRRRQETQHRHHLGR